MPIKYIEVFNNGEEDLTIRDAEAHAAHQVKVVEVSVTGTKSESPASGEEIDVIYVNTANSAVTVTIAHSSTVKTPNGSDITITIPVGGYGEASFANIGGTIYARGV